MMYRQEHVYASKSNVMRLCWPHAESQHHDPYRFLPRLPLNIVFSTVLSVALDRFVPFKNHRQQTLFMQGDLLLYVTESHQSAQRQTTRK